MAHPRPRPRATALQLLLLAALLHRASAERQLQQRPSVARPPAYCLALKQSSPAACNKWQESMCQYINTTGYKCECDQCAKAASQHRQPQPAQPARAHAQRCACARSSRGSTPGASTRAPSVR